ncbi:MAG TPA: 3-hydroxy-5-phosphonooxypentane-2,4-dione thiolase [Candidatus Nanoarchaeia archaeon]|nr:3-hydroxy-5-phosphonooxypentane-2,4-dione thiolase [Candidatus Nanoarchaeia archaeon]
MDWGKLNRMSSILNSKSGNTVMLAIDHGYFQGPTTGLKNPEETVKMLLPYADCLFATRGILRNVVDANTRVPVFLRVSGGTSILGELSNEDIHVSIKEVLRLNAAGAGISIFVGAQNEDRTLGNLSRFVNEAQEYGIPVLAITAVGREMNRDARYLGLACRIAAELGADMVKTYYCDDFESVVKSCPIPIVIAGGKKIPERDALEMSRNAIDAGAIGVDMGRNIFQSESPTAMIQAVRAIVHEGAAVEEAYDLYNKLHDGKKLD